MSCYYTYRKSKQVCTIIDIDILDNRTPYKIRFGNGSIMWVNECFLSEVK